MNNKNIKKKKIKLKPQNIRQQKQVKQPLIVTYKYIKTKFIIFLG
jgi:hypothetical protein